MDWLLLISMCLLIGSASGFVAGLLGVGGGIIIVPALILLFDSLSAGNGLFASNSLTTIVAVATSLACVLVTTALSGWSQLRHGRVHMVAVRRWAPFLIIGSALSGFAAPELPEAVIRLFIATLVLSVAIILACRWTPPAARELPGPAASGAMGAATGFASGIAGIGGGNLMIPSFLYFNIPIHAAMGTSSFLGPSIALSGVFGYILRGWQETTGDPSLLGYVHLPSFAVISLAALFFAPMGVRFAHARSPEALRRLLVVLLFAGSLRMGFSAIDVF